MAPTEARLRHGIAGHVYAAVTPVAADHLSYWRYSRWSVSAASDVGVLLLKSHEWRSSPRAGQAFLYDSGQVLELDKLASFPGASVASGGLSINDSGQITGYYSSSGSSRSHAFLYSNGEITDLGTLGGLSSSGNSINSAGQITGVADTAAGVQHAFLYTNGQMIDIGTLPGTSTSRGTGINNAARDRRHCWL
jgi:probable HAF family extracellular repeat protein